uniref:Outer dynein arm-docking complex subunit 4 n=1 Tax=Denticeps clupeoides TaxID=299321 RepID=A0AAY4BDE1_9TELE
MTDAKSTFFSYVAEGDQFYQKGEFSRATESYSTALAQQPQEKNCLVARSRCYVKMGDSAKALQDAEASLQEDKTFFRVKRSIFLPSRTPSFTFSLCKS